MIYCPATVTLELTNACNLRCKHCFSFAGESFADELSYEEIRRVLKELQDMGTMEIDFGGGEPFLRPDLLEVLDATQSLDFEIVLLTNGTLIDDAKASRLSDYSIKHVQISLDGLSNAHERLRGKGTFELAITAMEALRDHGIKFAVRTTATRESLGDLKDLADIAVEKGAYKFGVVRFFPAGRGMAYMDDLMLNAVEMSTLHRTILNIYKIYGHKIEITADPCGSFEGDIFQKLRESGTIMCPCAKTWCLIKPNGVVSPCEIMTFYAGNVRKNKIQTIWENAPIFKLFREFKPELLKGACGTCKHKGVCGGYCRALAILHSGDIYSEDFTCYHVMKKML